MNYFMIELSLQDELLDQPLYELLLGELSYNHLKKYFDEHLRLFNL